MPGEFNYELAARCNVDVERRGGSCPTAIQVVCR